MENILYNELKIRGFKVDVGVVEKYGKDQAQKTIKNMYEIDFVASREVKSITYSPRFPMAPMKRKR